MSSLHNIGGEAMPSEPVLDSRISNDEFKKYSFDDLAQASSSFNRRYRLGKGGSGKLLKALSGKEVAIKQLSRISNDEFEKYSFDELAQATGFFNQKYLLGKGGFGLVFKATLSGKEVAIKKLLYDEQRGKQFEAEISVLAKLKHQNLVNMLGYCCDEDNNRLLVLELMPNKSLLSHLQGGYDKPVLEWSKRMIVALGSAKGITFLHEPPIVHRDIKPENILLADDFEPKITDFGLSSIMNTSHVSTQSYATSGYMAPECKRHNKPRVTNKSDVFSFGIVLLEFITGKKPKFSEDGGTIYLSSWAAKKLKYALSTGNYINLVDVKLKKKYDKAEMGRMIYCAAASVYKSEENRPTMSQIADVLEGKMEKEEVWKHPDDEEKLRNPYYENIENEYLEE